MTGLVLSSLVCPENVRAMEGFFRPGFLATDFDQHRLASAIYAFTVAAQGTLFFISPDGHFLTNRHVVAPFLNRLEEEHLFNSRSGYNSSVPLILKIDENNFLGEPIYIVSSAGERIKIETIEFYAVPRKISILGLGSRIAGLHNDFILGRINYKPANWIHNVSKLGVDPKRSSNLFFSMGYPQLDSMIPHRGNAKELAESNLLPALYSADDLTTRDVWHPELLVSVGKIQAIMPFVKIAVSDMDSMPGNSGGPIFDLNGKLSGVSVGQRITRKNRDGSYDPNAGSGFFPIPYLVTKLNISNICPSCFTSCESILSDQK